MYINNNNINSNYILINIHVPERKSKKKHKKAKDTRKRKRGSASIEPDARGSPNSKQKNDRESSSDSGWSPRFLLLSMNVKWLYCRDRGKTLECNMKRLQCSIQIQARGRVQE